MRRIRQVCPPTVTFKAGADSTIAYILLPGQKLRGRGLSSRTSSPLQDLATLQRAADVDGDRHLRRKTSVREPTHGGNTNGSSWRDPNVSQSAALRSEAALERFQVK